MAEQNTPNLDDPTGEILSSAGLITMLGAVMAAVIAVAELAHGDVAMAALLGAVAFLSFGVSLACFYIDSNQAVATPVTLPGWLRTNKQVAAELSAAR